MIHILSCYFASYCATHDIIDQQHFSHLQYKTEIFLQSMVFVFCIILLSAITHLQIETGILTLTIYLFRKRMGGWHASRPWICFIISLALILIMTLIVAPLANDAPKSIFFLVCLALDFVVAILPPAFPPQLHFSTQEKNANIKRKNQLLVVVIAIQIIAFLWCDFRIDIYTFLGLAITVFSVLLEKTIQLKKGMRTHEKA